jgi:hypothetical protein
MSPMTPMPRFPLPPDPVVEAYKAGIDRSLLRDNLRLSPTERVVRLQQAVRAIRALQQSRGSPPARHG